MRKIWGNDQTQFFYSLSLDEVLKNIERLGLFPTGGVLALNSMENRVYQIEVDHPDFQFLVTKFYRPGRWTKEQILEEHEFLLDLQSYEINVIAPMIFNGETLFTSDEGLFYTVFPRKGGRAADEWTTDLLEQMGRLVARLHNVGASKKSSHRLRLDIETFGEQNLQYLLSSKYMPKEIKDFYQQTCEAIFQVARPLFNDINYIRVHGDCHHGNTLLNEGAFLIDFDDMLQAPAVQDLWMVIPGRDPHSKAQLDILLNAYQEMRDFDYRELKLIEVLRALRIIHFSSWIAHRYEDQSFQQAFPHFASADYFQKELQCLREQLSFIQEQG